MDCPASPFLRVCVRYGTKTGTVTEEAYERLWEVKRDDASFTDVLLRMTGGDKDVMRDSARGRKADPATVDYRAAERPPEDD
ncbi:antitoxin VapB family protein [Haloferax marisrubri]|uniref:Uncharacterized protein n=1 Tax=Haloferax marisrubri TaxID=1544719 RepID=A0A2P4NSW8_9EURY|nr:antitoxin VapB family protein [Haloferax marisrubri]POG56257.1 hypothetical protein AUR65_007030 [Haloferax marisrubri]